MPDFNDTLFMRALRRQPTPRRPLWLMRQAGRYLPEYQRTRKAAGGFLTMMKTPAAACEVTLQPIQRFGFDAAIIFSDILTIPDALGLGLYFEEGKGPRFTAPLTDESDIRTLSPLPPEALRYVFDACATTRLALPANVPLIGFCGAPFTLACYMVDGGGGEFWQARRMRQTRPDLFHHILNITADAVATSLIEQVGAGCQAVMLFDSWGGILADDDYEEFSLQYIRRAIAAVTAATGAPVIVFGRRCHLSLAAIAASGCAGIGVDWNISLSTARRLAGDGVALQGNMDPAVLLTDPQTVAAAAAKTLNDYGNTPGHIFNLGHGVDKRTPPENVAALVAAVRAHTL